MTGTLAETVAPITDACLHDVLAVNNAYAQETSFLTRDALRGLVEASFVAVALAQGKGGFLIAMTEQSVYQGTHFRWFQSRFPAFVYVDRIVIARAFQKQGAGRALYDHLFTQARRSGRSLVACEVNLDPPNPGSDAFHAALGFEERARWAYPDLGKTVRYLTRTL